MQALILAAGRGSRMGTKTAEVPKCLLEVGGKPLIEHMLEALADAGVGPVGIVAGYMADDIREVVGTRADIIENPRWSRTNSLYSFWLAREWVEGPVMVLNSDLLLSPQILERMAGVSDNALAYDAASGGGAEQMKVKLDDGTLVAMSKTLPPEDVSGENVGVLGFTATGARRLFQLAGEAVEAGKENDWLGTAVSALALECPIRAIDVGGLPWAEIDFSYDLDRARRQVWPRIRNRDRGRLLGGFAKVVGALGIAAWAFMLLAFLFGRHAPASWDALELDELAPVQIEAGNRKQRWWMLRTGDEVVFEVTGPTAIRFSSRPVLDGVRDSMRYALGLEIDGRPVPWDDHLATASHTWHSRVGTVGKRDDFSVSLPDGSHRLTMRLVTGQPGAVLLLVSEGFDEDNAD